MSLTQDEEEAILSRAQHSVTELVQMAEVIVRDVKTASEQVGKALRVLEHKAREADTVIKLLKAHIAQLKTH